MTSPISLLVLWSREASDDDFAEYYRRFHLPLARQLPGLLALSVRELRSKEYSRLAELEYADRETLRSSLASAVGAEVARDAAEMERRFGVRQKSIVADAPIAVSPGGMGVA